MNPLLILQTLIPVLGTISGHPELAQLASKLTTIGEEEIARRMAARGETRAQVLADADKTWNEAVQGAEALKALP